MFGSLANNTSSATLSLADTLMNDTEKRIISSRDWPFLWRQYTDTTTANTQAYALPAYTDHPQGVYITVGGYRYVPEEVSTREEWDELNETVRYGDSVTHYFVYDNNIEFYPIPATSSNVITFNARRRGRDLNTADITSSTITTLANGSKALTVSGGLTTQMAGFWIRPTFSTTANTGDGFWYEIAAVTNSTTATLQREYGGVSISAGSAASTIAQLSLMPEAHQQLPIFEALNIYFTSVEPNPTKATLYGNKFKDGYQYMVRDYGSKMSVVLDDGEDDEMTNPNLQVSL